MTSWFTVVGGDLLCSRRRLDFALGLREVTCVIRDRGVSVYREAIRVQ